MFGYLQPEKPELKIKEYELYKSVYCGLCRHLGRDYGVIARMTLSYDCTVLAMMSMALGEPCPHISQGRCRVNPFRKCQFGDCEGESYHLAGAVSVIMSYEKLGDTIADSGFWKRVAARFLRGCLKRNYRKASEAYPVIAEQTRQMMIRQKEAEASDCGIDRAADPTAVLLSELCQRLVPEGDERRETLKHFGYYLGRWIYLIDAADDYEKDLLHHQFNPFRKADTGDREALKDYCNDVLNLTAAQMILAYDLLELKYYQEILDNIVHHGLSLQQKLCIFEKGNKKGSRHQQHQTVLPDENRDSEPES